MTKDRRLGRGLAALLGTPLDESNIVDGTATESADSAPNASRSAATRASASESSGSSQALSRPQPPSTTGSAARPAPNAPAHETSAAAPPSALQSAPSTGSPAGARPQQSPKPRTVIASNSGVTGSVPLSSVLPAQGNAGAGASHSAPHSPATSRSAAVPPASLENAAVTSSTHSLDLDVSLIDANPFQPRRQFNEEEIASLAESIKEHKQLQPVLVRQVGTRYQLISGERRLRATMHAGLKTVRAEVREADDRLVAELAIVENLQRKDLNPIEKALSFRRYLDEHACTQDELAKRLKIDRSTIANLMRLLELPTTILEAVQSDTLSAGHARALLPLGEEAEQCAMAAQIQAEGWSVRQTEHAVSEILAAEDGARGAKPAKGKRNAARTVTPQIGSLEQELRRSLGTKIEIRQSARGRGKIVVHFHSAEEFERIRELLVPAGQRAAA